MQEYFEIGQIVNHFGVKGMVKVMPYTDDITRFDNLKKVYVVIRQTQKQYIIEQVKYHRQNRRCRKIKKWNFESGAQRCDKT